MIFKDFSSPSLDSNLPTENNNEIADSRQILLLNEIKEILNKAKPTEPEFPANSTENHYANAEDNAVIP